MNILLLVGVGLVFWHLFHTEGDGIASTPAAPAVPATSAPTDTNAVATGDVTTSSVTP